jgi:hypothetical protein
MRFLTLTVVIIIACIIFYTVEPNNGCPNPTFVQKHICRGDPTAENALECSKLRNQNPRLSKTNKNTVFMGTSGFDQVGSDCINSVKNLFLKCFLSGQQSITKKKKKNRDQ